MRWLPGPETRAAVAKHPFVLAGLSVVVLLGLTAAVLIVIDSFQDPTAAAPQVKVEPQESRTPGVLARTAVSEGLFGTTRSTTAVRFVPGENAAILGTLQRNTEIQIDGRTTDSTWFRVIFPPNSELHGWVDAEDLDVTGDASALAIATAEPPIVVEQPTLPPSVITQIARGETPVDTETPTPEATGTALPGLPDLVVGPTPTVVDGKLFITVVNQGTGPAVGDLVIAVFNPERTALLAGATLPDFTLEAGTSIDIGTGYDVPANRTYLLIVDPNGDIEESDNTNNQITIAIALGGEPPPPPEAPAP
jgi:hypothetical protein